MNGLAPPDWWVFGLKGILWLDLERHAHPPGVGVFSPHGML